MNCSISPRHLATKKTIRALSLLLAAGVSAPAFADFQELVTFPAGLVCSFALKVESDGSGVRVNRAPVNGRWLSISAGTGSDLRLTNVSTNATLTLQGNGAVTMVQKPDANGSLITRMTGHNILFMFPTDTPPGPSSTLYVGQVVFSNDALNNTTLLSHRGETLDICAALSS